MYFFNYKLNPTKQEQRTNNVMQLINRNHYIYNPPQAQPGVTDTIVKKVKWGEPIWFLFHTLSVKIKESHFQKIRKELLDNIYQICINLPCPECANHSKTYLEGIHFNSIQTKTDLKKFLHKFHNDVNIRKGYPLFPYEDLDEKYSRAKTIPIIHNFMFYFSERNRNIKLLATDFHRQNLCSVLKEWFNNNITAFDP